MNNPQPGDATAAINNPAIAVNAPTVTIEREDTIEPYLWEELLVYLLFHIVALGMCIHPTSWTTD